MSDRIILGCGNHSAEAVQYLHNILDQAIVLLGGIQQPPTSTESPQSQYEIDEIDITEQAIRFIATEIYLRLTGEAPILPEKQDFK